MIIQIRISIFLIKKKNKAKLNLWLFQLYISNLPLLFPPSLKDLFGLGCIYPLLNLPHFIDTLWTFVEMIGLVKVLNPISGYCLIFHEMCF